MTDVKKIINVHIIKIAFAHTQKKKIYIGKVEGFELGCLVEVKSWNKIQLEQEVHHMHLQITWLYNSTAALKRA